MPLQWGALVLLVGGALLGGPGWTGLGGLVLLVAGLALYFRGRTVRRPPVEVAAPVAGRWTAVNSPADKVPGHGLHAYGQTYAIDLVHEPADESRPAFGSAWGSGPGGLAGLWPAGARPGRRGGRQSPRRRAGPSRRSSWPSLLYLFAQGSLRELTVGLPFRLACFEVDGHPEAGCRPTASRSRSPRRADLCRSYRLQWVSPSR